MQVFLLVMVMAIFLHDAQESAVLAHRLTGWTLIGTIALPKLAIALIYAAMCRMTYRALMTSRGLRSVGRLDRFTSLYRLVALGLYGYDLYVGLLMAIRGWMGDWILIDEFVVMAPTLGLIMWGWWCFYPIDRRLREATLIGRLDSGEPIYPIWTRGQYMLAQVRHQFALILLPLLALMGWVEAVMMYLPDRYVAWAPGLALLGAAMVFLLAPLVIRHVWDTSPLPPGDLRNMLTAMCRKHRVGVRELLLWRTFGGMINAAVMGIVGPLRYILLTDALLDMMPLPQVEAVMAHELAHVRRHHMFWLIVVAGTASGLLQLGCMGLAKVLLPPPPENLYRTVVVSADMLDAALRDPRVIEALLVGGAVAGWLLIFGWVSRRFERQADTFAVQHLAAKHGEVIDDDDVATMVQALGRVASLNHLAVEHRSWRHGSISWRQQYLRSLVGRPVQRTPIDRQVRWIKLLAALALLGMIAAGALGLTGDFLLL